MKRELARSSSAPDPQLKSLDDLVEPAKTLTKYTPTYDSKQVRGFSPREKTFAIIKIR